MVSSMRLRRYRAGTVIIIVTIFVLWELSSTGGRTESPLISVEHLKNYKRPVKLPLSEELSAKTESKQSKTLTNEENTRPELARVQKQIVGKTNDADEKGRLEDASSYGIAGIHYQRNEKYPIPKEELFKLPKMSHQALPKIQGQFAPESSSTREIREKRQNAVKRAFIHAWAGYRRHAWGHDEIKPITAESRDPFGGWSATIIDSLETLAIMDLKSELQVSLEFLERLDFTTTRRSKIPVFETAIRYLGGLLGAYDVTQKKYPILLEKAVQLGDVLLGSMDTPNHMPLLYYDFRPESTSRVIRAGKKEVLAELGSLTLEFTRLAQITGNDSYFDAVLRLHFSADVQIQRITNGLDALASDTHIPGMWPTLIDASGCKSQDSTQNFKKPKLPSSNSGSLQKEKAREESVSSMSKAPTTTQTNHQVVQNVLPTVAKGDEDLSSAMLLKRAVLSITPGRFGDASSSDVESGTNLPPDAIRSDLHDLASDVTSQTRAFLGTERSPDLITNKMLREDLPCEEQGLTISPSTFQHTYTVGGLSDSVYEYLLKEYILVGGNVDQYKRLYENFIEAAKKHVFFRPLVEGDPDILFMANTVVDSDGNLIRRELEGSHLKCFVGGMVAIGSRVLGRRSELKLAEKLTNGCVWSYAATRTHLMPETFEVAECLEDECHWASSQSAEKSKSGLLPEVNGDSSSLERKYRTKDQLNKQRKLGKIDSSKFALAKPEDDTLDISDHALIQAAANGAETDAEGGGNQAISDETLSESRLIKRADPSTVTKPKTIPNNKPSSFTRIKDARYLLRPEAIESVFIMYRVSGDRSWQDKGWDMFQATDKATRTEFAHASLKDVTDLNGEKLDIMESFWLAETLKYHFLLQSSPDLISLDEYVLNTEAHAFTRT